MSKWSSFKETKVLFENFRKFVNKGVQQVGKFRIVTREDGKIVLIHEDTFEHIGTHQEPGIGSVFSENITPEIIIKIAETEDIPETGDFVTVNWPGAGYELVKPMGWVRQNLPDAEFAVAHKDEFDPVKKEKIKVPVVAARTAKSIEDPLFATTEVSIGIFKYNPAKATAEQNEFVKNTPVLNNALQGGKLFSLPTAFPGGSEEIEGEKIERASLWGGSDPERAKWAVIIPEG